MDYRFTGSFKLFSIYPIDNLLDSYASPRFSIYSKGGKTWDLSQAESYDKGIL